MTRSPGRLLLAALSLAPLAFLTATPSAATPRVAASIAPLQSLAAMVMRGVGEPALIVRPGASPHTYALKPSEARALDEAEIVFWVGEELETFLERPLETLAGDATVVGLAGLDGVRRLPPREGGVWEAHDDAHEEEHAHDDEHGHEEGHAHEDGHGHEAEAQGHHRDALDPHLWLDPENAEVWLTAMAETLAGRDPENAATYRANAAAARATLEALQAEIVGLLAPVKDRPYIVFHDAYQYFETRFATAAVGSISLSDATRPSAARVAEIRRRLADSGAVCVFAEPQFEPRLIETVVEGSAVKTGILDPLGADLQPGPDLYPALLRRMATALADCLS